MKCLIPNHVAGMIIGKDGQNIQKLMDDMGVTVRVSSPKSFFPGTQMRVVSSMGHLANIHAFIRWLVGKLAETNSEGGSDVALQFKVLVSHYGSGVIIGKGGATIKEIQADTGATMSISQKDQSFGVPERILTIIGSQDSVSSAAEEAINKAQNEEDTLALQNMLNYGSTQQSSHSSGNHPQALEIAAMYRQAVQSGTSNPFTSFGSVSGGIPGSSDGLVDMTAPGATRCTIEISVPDYLCSVTMDNNSQLIAEIQSMSGCSVRVSSKGDFIPGSFNRMVTIRGTYGGTHTAYYLLMQKLGQGNQEVPFMTGMTPQTMPSVSQAQMMQQLQGYYSQIGSAHTQSSLS